MNSSPLDVSAARGVVHPVMSAVSVVVPTHRRPELLRKAVLSVVAQQYRGPIEIIVVFDACDPDLPHVELPPHVSLRALVNERSRGLAGARNTGIVAARHDLVAFLDDDDEWFPGKLEAQVRLMDSDPDAVLVGTAMTIDDGTTHRDRHPSGTKVSRRDLLVRGRLAGPHASSFMFRRQALLGPIGLVDEDLPRSYGEDYDLLLRTAEHTDIRVVDTPLILARWQGQSYYYAQWQAYAEALQYLLDKHPLLRQERAARARTHAQIAFSLASCGRRSEAVTHARRSLTASPLQPKAWLALAIGLHIVSGDQISRLAQRFGRGI